MVESFTTARLPRTLAAGLASLLLLALLVSVGPTPAGASPSPVTKSGAGTSSTCFSWYGQEPLQDAVNQAACVTIAAGVYQVPPISLPLGETLRGAGQGVSVLEADTTAYYNCCEGILSIPNPPTGAQVSISNLTLDGQDHALIGILGAHFLANDVTVENITCDGITIGGPGAIVEHSLLKDNGPGDLCPSAPPGGGIYVENYSGLSATYSPVIEHNVFRGNGTALDDNQISGGTFVGNSLFDNASWAGVSLYAASDWKVIGNTIVQPLNPARGDQPGGDISYQQYCQNGPDGGHPAGIWLCRNSQVPTDHNIIEGNIINSWYGILVMGAAAVSPTEVPAGNLISHNQVTATQLGCADEAAPGVNTWINNDCGGPSAPGPVYF